MRVFSLILFLAMPVSAETYRQVWGLDGQVSRTIIERVDDHAFIPVDPANRDYATFLAWQKQGGRIQPPVPLEPVDPKIDEARKLILDSSGTEKERLEALITYLGIK